MSRLLIEPVTPDEPGYIALKAESIALNFNMLRRLEENWQRGENRFNAPGEKLLGAFLNGRLVGVCGLNRDPFSQQPRAGRIRHLYVSEKCRGLGIGKQLLTVVMADASIWFDFLNTHAPESAYGFYGQAGFTLVSDEPRVTHRLFCAV
ncbi:TPA: GNAT family N-acetyltransferase [Enterobacter asburiae]|jgi:GNAT superfamily N-acetyltransferase|uniref:GNAT family N-acetyltransferase n=1 Tax=Enterobacter asburiae TaxID=61645 RepID=UPI00301A744B|nr:GNAT family N-acetyltransferase [Enterobacter asburiae]